MPEEIAIGLVAALVGAIWVGIGAAAPEIIWQGLKLALAQPTWADLMSALMIGLILAFFIEPVMERVRDFLGRSRRSGVFNGELRRALFTIAMSFIFAIVSVALHDAMIAVVTGKGPGHGGSGTGLTTAILLTAEWAIVPFLITIAWESAVSDRLSIPLGVLGASSPVIAGWLFSWPAATVITTAVPCLVILALGYVEIGREPAERAFIRCARRVAVVAAVWLPVALAYDWIAGDRGQFYGMTDFLVDCRFYLGWIVGLMLVPWPAARAQRMAP